MAIHGVVRLTTAVLFVVLFCGPDYSAHAAPPRSDAKTVNLGVIGSIDTLNPFQYFPSDDDPFQPLLFAKLWSTNHEGFMFPELATNVPTFGNHGMFRVGSELIITVHLRKGAQWSDGAPLTNQDVLFSWHVDKAVFGASPITTIDTPDPLTAHIHFPWPTLNSLGSIPLILPEHAFQSVGAAVKTLTTDDNYNYLSPSFVTSGPYKITKWDHSIGMELKPNPNYISKPPVENLSIHFFSDPQNGASAIGKTVDILTNWDLTLPTKNYPAETSVTVLPKTSLEAVQFNVSHGVLGDTAFRRALIESVDPAAILKTYLGSPPSNLIDTNSIINSLAPNSLMRPAFDPGQAKSDLLSSPYANQNIVITIPANNPRRLVEANAIATSWQGIGVKASVRTLPLSQIFDLDPNHNGTLLKGDFDVILLGSLTSADPAADLEPFRSTNQISPTNISNVNMSHISDPALDSAISTAENAMDPGERASAVSSAFSRIAQKAYYFPLFYFPHVTVSNGRVVNLHPSRWGDTWNAFQWVTKDSAITPPPLPDTSGGDINSEWKSSFAIDGVLGRGYETGAGKITNQSLTVGFKNDATATIFGFGIDPSATGGHPTDEALKGYGIQVSTTGTAPDDFTTVFEGSLLKPSPLRHFVRHSSGGDQGTSSNIQVVSLPKPVKAKYVRLLLKDNYGNPTYISLEELEIIGKLPSGSAAIHAAHHSFLSGQPTRKTASLGSVRYIKRGLSVTRKRKAQRAKVKMPLVNKDLLRTAKRQGASIRFRDGTTVHLNERTDAVISDPHTTLVKRGEIDQILAPGTDHKIQTSSAVAAAIGTDFDVKVKGATTTVTVIEGVALVTSSAGSVNVKAGQSTTVVAGQAPSEPVTANSNAAASWTHGYPKPNLSQNLALDLNGGHIVDQSS